MLARHQHGVIRNGAAGAALIANPHARQAAGRIARHIGQQGGRWLREQYDNWRRGEDDDGMDDKGTTDDNGNNNDAGMSEPNLTGGGSSAGVGFRGKLSGNTTLHSEFAEHYHENTMCHSRKIRNHVLNWAFKSKSGINTNFPGVQWLVGGAMGMRDANFAGNSAWPNNAIQVPPQPWESVSDLIMAFPINIYADYFIDNKLLNIVAGTARGIMANYQFFRLKSFTVELQFKTYNVGAASQWGGYYESFWTVPQQTPESGIKSESSWGALNASSNAQEIPISYWVYRDVYNDYTTNADPTTIPLSAPENNSFASPPDPYNRAAYSLRNQDIYLTLVKPGETFSYTRELSSFGNYYIPRAKLTPLLGSSINMQSLVNALERSVSDAASSPYINPLPESFNLLVAPESCPVALSRTAVDQTKVGGNFNDVQLVVPLIQTYAYAKYLATWEAFNYDYYSTTQGPQAEFQMDFGASSTMIDTVDKTILEIKKQRGSLF